MVVEEAPTSIGVLKQSPAGRRARRSGRGMASPSSRLLHIIPLSIWSPSHHPSLYLLRVQEDLDGVDRWGRGGASSFRCGFVVVAGEHGGEHQRGLRGGDLQPLREHSASACYCCSPPRKSKSARAARRGKVWRGGGARGRRPWPGGAR